MKITEEKLDFLVRKHEPNVVHYLGSVINLLIRKHNDLVDKVEELEKKYEHNTDNR